MSAVFFPSVFGHQNPGSGLDPDPNSHEMLDPYPDSMIPDPQLWHKDDLSCTPLVTLFGLIIWFIIISASRDTCIKKWDLRSGELVKSLNNAHKDWICGLSFLPGAVTYMKASLRSDIGLPIKQCCGSVYHQLTGTDPRIMLFFAYYFFKYIYITLQR